MFLRGWYISDRRANQLSKEKSALIVLQYVKKKTQEGCGGLGGENPGAFPKAWPIFQPPFYLPESAQNLAGITFRAAGQSGKNFPAASKFAGKLFQQGSSDSHSLLEFSGCSGEEMLAIPV